jgi:hypothetical protein
VASDCVEAVKGLVGANLGVYGSILLEIKARASQRGVTSFVHERREVNEEAHHMTRFASTLPKADISGS